MRVLSFPQSPDKPCAFESIFIYPNFPRIITSLCNIHMQIKAANVYQRASIHSNVQSTSLRTIRKSRSWSKCVCISRSKSHMRSSATPYSDSRAIVSLRFQAAAAAAVRFFRLKSVLLSDFRFSPAFHIRTRCVFRSDLYLHELPLADAILAPGLA